MLHAAGAFFKPPWQLVSSSPSTSQPCVPPKLLSFSVPHKWNFPWSLQADSGISFSKNLPNPEIEPVSPALTGGFFTIELREAHPYTHTHFLLGSFPTELSLIFLRPLTWEYCEPRASSALLPIHPSIHSCIPPMFLKHQHKPALWEVHGVRLSDVVPTP